MERDGSSLAEELADARLRSKAEVLAILESLTLAFLQAISRGEDPELHLVSESSEMPHYFYFHVLWQRE